MKNDPYKAVWVSHSSMGDFIKCPRAYFLHNVYKDPKTKRKINIVNPALALGVAVHEIVEGLANHKAETRFNKSIFENFENTWKKVSGKWGGFTSVEQEEDFKERAKAMLKRVEDNPGPLIEKNSQNKRK